MFPMGRDARIGVAAPSGLVDSEKFTQGIRRLEALGWGVDVDAGVFASSRYLAGSEVERKASLLRISSGHPHLLVAARGGYGAMRLLAHLDDAALDRLPLFMGFSDATALLVSLVGRGRRMIHGPTVQSLASASVETLSALKGLLAFGAMPDPLGPDWVPLVAGEGVGVFIGGNLTTLAHLCGTPYQPDFSGCILALEDVHEAPYRMDRALTQMRLSGLFAGVAGVVVGECLHCGDDAALSDVFYDIFSPLKIPVVIGGRFGHGATNVPLIFGARVALSSRTGVVYV